MSERATIDGHIAANITSAVEDFTVLQAALFELRLRMVRGEPGEMHGPLNSAKGSVAKLARHLAGLTFALRQATGSK